MINISSVYYLRTLSFWRALTAECISTFLYVLLVCCIHETAATTPELHQSSAQAYCGIVAGLAIISLTTIFLPVSGAHSNPALSLAAALIHRISPLRAAAHVVAQCGGAIAGASVVLGLYGATEHFPTITLTNFGLEFLLSFMIVLVYLRVTDSHNSKTSVDPAIPIGLSYMAALVAYKGAVNPALALGQAFVVSKFGHHWVFWVGPILGGSCAALCHEYIFNEQKDIQLALTSVKEDPSDGKKEKYENQTNKLSNNIHFKELDDQIPPTPPLPWNARRPIRSYSSEMIRTDKYPRFHQDEQLDEWESYNQEDCPTTGKYFIESSGYHSRPPSKPHNGPKTPSTQRKEVQDYNSQSLTRTQSHKHQTKSKKTSVHSGSGRKNDQGHTNSKPPKQVSRKVGNDSHFFVDY